MSKLVHSFDIWETCLIRTFAYPEHLFYEVARRYLTEKGEPVTADRLAELQRQRTEAEWAARKAEHARSGTYEVTLDEIYAQLRRAAPWLDAEAFRASEVAVEEASILPIAETRARLRKLRAEGARIVFISDMYLPEDVMRRFLVKFGMAGEDAPVYVSGPLRKHKGDGSLYHHVMAEEGTGPSGMRHTGNHPNSDHAQPAALGIATEPFTDDRLSVAEQLTLREAQGRPLLASRLAGHQRAARLSTPLPEGLDPAFGRFLGGVIAPALTVYVLWILRRARALGLNRLYFLARDGEILQRIYEAIAPEDAPEARYLYSSRLAWGFPSLSADAPWHWLRVHAQKPRSVLKGLRFSEEEIREILARPELAHLDPNHRYNASEIEAFWQVLDEPRLRERILGEAAKERAVLLDYFRQEGLFDEGSRWAVIDIGWTLSTQAALQRILKGTEAEDRVLGLYFLITKKRPPVPHTGPFDALLMEGLHTLGKHATGSLETLIGYHASLIEEVFLKAPDASTTGFARGEDGTVTPVKGANKTSGWEAAYCGYLRELVVNYARGVAPHIREEGDFEVFRHAALANLRRFLETPEREEAECVTRFYHITDTGHDPAHAESLLQPYTLEHAWQILRRRLRLGGRALPDPLWKGGSRALSSRRALRAMELAITPLGRLNPKTWLRR